MGPHFSCHNSCQGIGERTGYHFLLFQYTIVHELNYGFTTFIY